jgi:tryptophan-rich sensory protein
MPKLALLVWPLICLPAATIGGLFEALVDWCAMGITLVVSPTSLTAGKLMLPYFFRVRFAAFLNRVLWRMNPGAVGRAVPVA